MSQLGSYASIELLNGYKNQWKDVFQSHSVYLEATDDQSIVDTALLKRDLIEKDDINN